MNISSIDFLSPHQFQNITQSLLNGIFVEKLEAIETLCRLPALEHIIKPTLWPEIESGLQNALSSNVVLIKDASLKLYSKMLSSSEPKVVQESYTSLIKFFLHKLLPLLNQNNTDPYFMYKCKCAVEVIAILNKFLQNISSHWLRYPQSVIEEITVLSLSILSYSCKHSSHFPTWICVALCDPKAKWLKNILFGHISRGFLLSALERDFQMLQFAVKFCEKFACADDYLALKDKCCQKSALVAEITHIICFLSHILQYYQGREIFAYVSQGTLSPCWMNALNLVMKCTRKLCCITCFNCCAVVCEIVSKKWTCFWDGDISVTGNSLIEMLIFPNCDIGCTAVSSIYFTMQCLCEAFDSFYNVSDNLPTGKVDHFIC
ncbi:Protein broad-minded, partial [Stegodyphus mimosarum]